jgi:hypothetical protein
VLLPIHFRFPVVSRDFDKPAPLLVPSPCLAALGSDLNPNLVNMRKELILLNSIFFFNRIRRVFRHYVFTEKLFRTLLLEGI